MEVNSLFYLENKPYTIMVIFEQPKPIISVWAVKTACINMVYFRLAMVT